MNRERAIDLAEHLLRNLDDGQETWPLSLVTALYVFGSFARGALTPGDLDIDVEKTSDQQGRAVERVSAEALLPYIHQRYDDPQQIHDGPPQGSIR